MQLNPSPDTHVLAYAALVVGRRIQYVYFYRYMVLYLLYVLSLPVHIYVNDLYDDTPVHGFQKNSFVDNVTHMRLDFYNLLLSSFTTGTGNTTCIKYSVNN